MPSVKKATKKAAKKTAAVAVAGGPVHVGSGPGHTSKPVVVLDRSLNRAGREGNSIRELVLHNTDGALEGALARLKDQKPKPADRVSAHYVVDRTGTIYQLVDDSDTAWHSGNRPVNQRSIGIEIVAWKTATGMTGVQEAALIALAKFVLDAYGVPLASVVPHRRIVSTNCPGWVWPTDAALEAWKNAKLT